MLVILVDERQRQGEGVGMPRVQDQLGLYIKFQASQEKGEDSRASIHMAKEATHVNRLTLLEDGE